MWYAITPIDGIAIEVVFGVTLVDLIIRYDNLIMSLEILEQTFDKVIFP